MISKKFIIYITGMLLLTIVGFTGIYFHGIKVNLEAKTLEATILTKNDQEVIIQDQQHIIYTFKTNNIDEKIGTNILIEYTGLLDKKTSLQNGEIIDVTTYPVSKDENGIPLDWQDNGIFHNYYILAYNKLKTLTLDEKIGQLFLVRYPEQNAVSTLQKYKLGGYLFFEKDFRNKTEQDVKNRMNELQKVSNIPLLTAVDEEGGTIVRVSSNPNLASTRFSSSRELYLAGGFDKIKEDVIEKSKVLKNLGLNLNLAPVVDVSTNSSDYMYPRTLGENTALTSTYARTVIQASHGTGVSYTLKHFPGYGTNADTHTTSATDTRTLDDITTNDLPPFQAGINALAEAVLVSHNIVTSMDANNPASLSPSVHNLLRGELGFTGIIITDDLSMGAVSSIDNATVKAILAGNDLIITTDYETSINSVKTALNNGTISENLIDKLAFRILAWKYYKGLMFEGQK